MRPGIADDGPGMYPAARVNPGKADAAARAASVIREITYSPAGVVERTAAEALLLCEAHSAGVSLLEHVADKVMQRRAIVGPWARYTMTVVDSAFGIEHAVVAERTARLLVRPANHDLSLHALTPPATEILAAPLVDGASVSGALWVVLHDSSRQFTHSDASNLLDLGVVAGVALNVARTLAAAPRDRDALPRPIQPRQLSKREQQVCDLVARGHTNRQIAIAIGVGVKSVETYRARVADKLGFRNRADFVSYAAANGWLRP